MEYQNINLIGIQLRFPINNFLSIKLFMHSLDTGNGKKIKAVYIVCKDCCHIQRTYYVLYEPVPQ